MADPFDYLPWLEWQVQASQIPKGPSQNGSFSVFKSGIFSSFLKCENWKKTPPTKWNHISFEKHWNFEMVPNHKQYLLKYKSILKPAISTANTKCIMFCLQICFLWSE